MLNKVRREWIERIREEYISKLGTTRHISEVEIDKHIKHIYLFSSLSNTSISTLPSDYDEKKDYLNGWHVLQVINIYICHILLFTVSIYTI